MTDLSLGGGIRLPAASRGNRDTQVGSTHHFSGGIVLGDGCGVRYGLESHLEACAALLLTYRQDVAEITEQVLFEWFDEDGVIHKHFIDFITLSPNGTKVGYAVRPSARVSARYLAELSRIKEQAIGQGYLADFRLFTEADVCPIELFNAKLFHSVRRPDCFGDVVAQDVFNKMKGVVTVGHLVSECGIEGMGFRAVVRLIKSGHLQMLNYERISYETMVFKARLI